MARIYVSSTFSDLVDFREQVRTALRSMGHEDIAMEYYGAAEERPLDKCLNDVASCDLYVGIFALRYGYIPQGHNRSITEQEYRKAQEKKIPCLIFLADESDWPYGKVEATALNKINLLRKQLQTAHVVAFFKSPDELKAHIFQAVRNWEKKGERGSVPFMPEALPATYVRRDEHIRQLLDRLLDGENVRPSTICVHGAGGSGKTTLVRGVCHEEAILEAYKDGILWVTLGENPDILSELTKLYAVLTSKVLTFVDEDHASWELSQQLANQKILLVIDDVWNIAHLRPFHRGGSECSRLVTTRSVMIAILLNSQNESRIEVAEMTTAEAINLLTDRLTPQPTDFQSFAGLTERLGEWPLLLELTSAALHHRMALGATLIAGLTYISQLLEQKGITAFNQENPDQRNTNLNASLRASLELLTDEEASCYQKLAIFPEDHKVPLSAAAALWMMTEFDTEEQLARFADLSLLRFNLGERTFHFHNVVREWLIEQFGKPVNGERFTAIERELHLQLIESWGDPYNLPNDYAWRWYSYHLIRADNTATLISLLLDYKWLSGKLRATNANALITDYNRYLISLSGQPEHDAKTLVSHQAIQKLVRALRQTAETLNRTSDQLCGQLWGWLVDEPDPQLNTLLHDAVAHLATASLYPRTPSLAQSTALLILEGHTNLVTSVVVTPDGRCAVSASRDSTVKIWNLMSGECDATLSGHTLPVNGVAITPDGQRIISASADGTLKIWDITSGVAVLTLFGHTLPVNCVAVIPLKQHVISASDDGTLKIWDIATGDTINTLRGHSKAVTYVAVMPNGQQAVSASADHTLKVWDLFTGINVATLEGHKWHVTGVAAIADERQIVSTSADNTAKVWELVNGTEVMTLTGHTDDVTAAAIALDERLIITASADSTVKIWDRETGVELTTIAGHKRGVNSIAVTPDSTRVISASSDDTLRLWDLAASAAVGMRKDHMDKVSCIAVTSDGKCAVSGAYDSALKIWDLTSGIELATLSGHTRTITAVAVTPDGQR
ncbi:MAG: DUF4062 domain-containing protein, partial [Caldilineaceae bacterium]|nr:DUF4062 domain-containing protein [Caldilineaceae bacterium]